MQKWIALFLLVMILSCNNGTDSNPTPVQKTGTQPMWTSPYLDIMNGTIMNTSVHMQYTLNGGTDWFPCNGAVTSVSLSIGDVVQIRDSNDLTWVRNLGTVRSLRGAPDLLSCNQIYTGINNWWDVHVYKPGDRFYIFSKMMNLGDSYDPYPGTYTISFYLSDDRIIDASTDTLLHQMDYKYYTPSGVVNVSFPNEFPCNIPPSTTPGYHYIGVIIDSHSNVSELCEDNNVTLPEDVAVIAVSDDSALSNGAVKIVNSWGKGTWERKSDGHYWMPYDLLIANKMPIFFYLNENKHTPELLAVFDVEHGNRSEVNLTLGLGDPSNPLIEKRFETRTWQENNLGGNHPYPANSMVLDITEFAYAINDYDLYIKVDNYGSSSGVLKSFSLEYIDLPSKKLNHTGNQPFGAGTSICTINSKNHLTRSELAMITPPVQSISRSATSDSSAVLSTPSLEEIQRDQLSIGVYREGENYNKLYQGTYGTGYRPPSEEDWLNARKLRQIQGATSHSRAAFGGLTLPSSIDHSTSIHFPPIGNQGYEGSCSAYTVAYYIQTYTEAKERNWDLSAVAFNDSTRQPYTSTDRIFSPDFLYHQTNEGVDNGSFLGFAIETVLSKGGATHATMPYNDRDHSTWPSEAAWREAPQYRGDNRENYFWNNEGYSYFVIESETDIQMLKALLAQGYIVSTGINANIVYNNLSARDIVGYGGVWTPGTIDHAQTIVGYKDGTAWNPLDPDA